ncbi:hypothetical protein J0X20_33110 [Streptomyces sp. KCTC 0041BP]|nr:hypothetical protein [Streptomyces sp. KCTC 0041BP]
MLVELSYFCEIVDQLAIIRWNSVNLSTNGWCRPPFQRTAAGAQLVTSPAALSLLAEHLSPAGAGHPWTGARFSST